MRDQPADNPASESLRDVVAEMRIIVHDALGPLTAATFVAADLARGASESDAIHPDLLSLQQFLHEALKRLQVIFWASDSTEPVAVSTVLSDVVELIAKSEPGGSTHVDVCAADFMMSAKSAFAVRAAVEEAVRNAWRHGTPPVNVSVTTTAADLTITVTDSGSGFDAPSPTTTVGLDAMDYFTSRWNGSVEISPPGQSPTTIKLKYPIAEIAGG